MVKNLESIMTIYFFQIFDLKGPKSEKIMCEIVAQWQIEIWGQTMHWIKELKTDAHFFGKNGGSVFFNFFFQCTAWSQIAVLLFRITRFEKKRHLIEITIQTSKQNHNSK